MELLCKYVVHAQTLILERSGRHKKAAPSDRLPAQAQAELDRLVECILQATKDAVVLPYKVEDVLEVAEGKISHKDVKLRERFGIAQSDADLPLQDRPRVYLDYEGRIVAWYLPGLFSPKTSDHVLESTRNLGQQADTILEVKAGSSNWRDDPKTFTERSACTVPPGQVALAPCWYELAQTLRKPGGGGLQFLADECHTNALIGALLAIVHPDLYDMQMNVLGRLNSGELTVKHADVMEKALALWASPFTGMALISNRQTPFHRDLKGGKLLYDVLATFGRYRGGVFEVPLLGSRFLYGPGTGFVFPGFLLEHGACKVHGDRVCFASFIKPNVGYGAYSGYSEVPLPTIDVLQARYGIVIDA